MAGSKHSYRREQRISSYSQIIILHTLNLTDHRTYLVAVHVVVALDLDEYAALLSVCHEISHFCLPISYVRKGV